MGNDRIEHKPASVPGISGDFVILSIFLLVGGAVFAGFLLSFLLLGGIWNHGPFAPAAVSTPSPTPVGSFTPVLTRSPIPPPTRNPQATLMELPSLAATQTFVVYLSTLTFTPTVTRTPTATRTKTPTVTPTVRTATPTLTAVTPSKTPTAMPTQTSTRAPSWTPTSTVTLTPTITPVAPSCAASSPSGLNPTFDTWIESAHPNLTHTTEAILNLNTSSDNSQRVLLKFDVTPSPGTGITDAKLYLYVQSVTDAGVTVFIHPVTSAWDQSATWNDASTSQPWSKAGGDFKSSPVLSFQPSGNCYVTLDVQPLVQEWYDGGSTNDGLILIAVGPSGAQVVLSANEDPASRPPLLNVSTSP